MDARVWPRTLITTKHSNGSRIRVGHRLHQGLPSVADNVECINGHRLVLAESMRLHLVLAHMVIALRM